MPLQIVKQLAVEEDIEFGIGSVTQPRDADGDGVAEDVVYTKVSSSSIPHLQLDDITETDVRAELNNTFNMTEADARFAALAGDSAQVFSVENPSVAEHAVNEGYLATYVAAELFTYPQSSEVLTKTNIVSYSPTADYHPCTKKYVDDLTIATGAGDMLKSVYDIANSGVVDNSELLGGMTKNEFMAYKGETIDLDTCLTVGYWVARAGANGAPIVLDGFVTTKDAVVDSSDVRMQEFQTFNGDIYARVYLSESWQAWIDVENKTFVYDDLYGSSDPDAALSANQGNVLAVAITDMSFTVVPIGGIIILYNQAIPDGFVECNGSGGRPSLVKLQLVSTSKESHNGKPSRDTQIGVLYRDSSALS